MSWSTREIADLAGTSLRAVRHYHDVGLLEEPERRANGYKQYGVHHLVRILRIKRLTDLGFSLHQIAEMGETDDHPAEALQALDADLAATIARLEHARAELKTILDQDGPVGLPPELIPVAGKLNAADRSFITVMTRVLGPDGVKAWTEVLDSPVTDPANDEFDSLPADADEQTRSDLAERLVPYVQRLYAQHPGLNDVGQTAPKGPRHVGRTMGMALQEIYNPAQLDVMRRMSTLLRAAQGAPGTDPEVSRA